MINAKTAELILSLGDPEDGDVFAAGGGRLAKYSGKRKRFTVLQRGAVLGHLTLKEMQELAKGAPQPLHPEV